MIRVAQPAAPANYGTVVRTPGLQFLATHPHPTWRQWRKHNYWTRIHGDLYSTFNGICNYCSSWSPRRAVVPTPQDHQTSIDHFIPKVIDPAKAYEWSNFRLCRVRLNSNKNEHQDVLDPYTIADDWFWIDFETFLLGARPGLSSAETNSVLATIARLGLNSDADYVAERMAIIGLYSLDQVSLAEVESKYPFLAQQIAVQKFDTQYKTELRAHFTKMTNEGRWSVTKTTLFPS